MMSEVYHERQRLQLCAVHAINNILQDKDGCTKKELDQLSNEFAPNSWINPHKSALGLGNYDVNVVMGFLERKGYDVTWFDKRKSVEDLFLANILGVILNRKTTLNVFGSTVAMLPFYHWYAVRAIDGQYYNLDSKLVRPVPIGHDAEFRIFLAQELRSQTTEMLVIREKEES